jgi:hypothetical protein
VVLIGLAVRLSVSLNRKKDFSSTMGTSGAVGMRPAGQMVPTAAAPAKRGRGRERAPEPETLGPVAVLDWTPAGPPEPAMAEPAPRQRRPRDDDFDYEEQPRRRFPDEEYADTSARMRRPALDDTSTRMRRPEMDDTSARMRRPDMDDTSTRMRRVEMDDTSTRMRRVEMDDSRYEEAPQGRRYEEEPPRGRRFEEEAPRPRRHADDGYDDAPRGRRRADDGYDDVPRQRGGSPYPADGRYGRDEVDAPRARRDRGAYDEDSADPMRSDSGRHSRGQLVPDYDDDRDYREPDETPTLIDMASRRARREAAQQETVSGQPGRGARRGGRGRGNDDAGDDGYWSQLRGEAN